MRNGEVEYLFNAFGRDYLIPKEVLEGPMQEFVQFVRIADPDANVISVSVANILNFSADFFF